MTRPLVANPARFRTQQQLFFFVPGEGADDQVD